MPTSTNVVLSHYKKHDPRLHSVLKSIDINSWIQPRKTSQYFASLCKEIISQQLAGFAAKTIHGRFLKLMDGSPTPEKILSIKDQALRDVGMSWAKVEYIKDLAHKASSKKLTLPSIDPLPNKEVVKKLCKVKGIGPWTAEMFLIFSLGREDVFSFGDLGLKKGIAKLYSIDNPTKKQIEKIIEPWSPYKTYGSIALWHYLDQ